MVMVFLFTQIVIVKFYLIIYDETLHTICNIMYYGPIYISINKSISMHEGNLPTLYNNY